ncbi:ROK family protein [Fusobacterium perfoetens]|uniref:ROK family protein n=1 Tax=Fusobacterium perfoetens TaxID=852 RepID=UPI001F2AF1BB|nr:ROK family protein [Fusobacterium perfoetens]MCF2613166.1 ROK family protein [Fusobacterium perfoetens]
MKYIAGVDIGGTNTKIGIVSSEGRIVAKESIKTLSMEGVESTLKRIWASIKGLLEKNEINYEDLLGVGMGIPGPVREQEIVGFFANFPWEKNLNIAKLFRNISGKETKLENDVNVIALGEARHGAGKGAKTSITIALGTGIGGGIYIDGKILSGFNGAGGEVGHMKLVKDGKLCGCGQKGCFEAYASATGIEREAISRLKVNKTNKLYQKLNGEIDKVEAKDVFDCAKEGDAFSLDIVDYEAEYLAMGIGNVLNLINPEKIILAGGVSLAGDILLDRVKEKLPKYAMSVALENGFSIELGILGNDSGIYGASALIG